MIEITKLKKRTKEYLSDSKKKKKAEEKSEH